MQTSAMAKWMFAGNGVMFLALTVMFVTGLTQRDSQVLSVERLNIVDSTGGLALVLANGARLPGGRFGGKEYPQSFSGRGRSAGMIFYNEVGDEVAGLIYEGASRDSTYRWSFATPRAACDSSCRSIRSVWLDSFFWTPTVVPPRSSLGDQADHEVTLSCAHGAPATDPEDVTMNREQLASLLRDVGSAHHRAFAAVDGDDPDWPRWYAEYLIPRLPDELSGSYSRDALAARLKQLDQDYRAGETHQHWAEYYAERLS